MKNIQYLSLFSILSIVSIMGCIDPNPGAYINTANVQIRIISLELERYDQEGFNETCLSQGYSIERSMFNSHGRLIELHKKISSGEISVIITGPENSTTELPMNISDTDKSYYYRYVAVLEPKDQIRDDDHSRVDKIKDALKTEVTKFFTAANFTADWNNVTIGAH